MAATETAPRVAREILDERWRSATTRPKVFQEPDGSRSTGLDNIEDWYRWERTVVDIATHLYGDGLDENQLENVEHIAATIWDETLRVRLLQWAEEVAR